MTLPRFLVPELPAAGSPVALGGDEGRHAAVVRRVRRGEGVELGDGLGGVARCVVTGVDRDGLRCRAEDVRVEAAPQPRLVVVQALVKGERGELAVELLTELGADVLVPWQAARSVVRWTPERAARGLARWRATAREAAKQSRRAWLPVVEEPVDTVGAAARVAAADCALVLHEAATEPLAAVDVPDSGELCLVVGPEGGLDEAEVTALTAAGGRPVRLGREVLRASTAGAAALAAVISRTPRWRDT